MEINIKSPNGTKLNIKAKRRDVKWNGDKVSMYQIGRSESDPDEKVEDWIPSRLMKSLDRTTTRKSAIVGISDYIAGWFSSE